MTPRTEARRVLALVPGELFAAALIAMLCVIAVLVGGPAGWVLAGLAVAGIVTTIGVIIRKAVRDRRPVRTSCQLRPARPRPARRSRGHGRHRM